ncbi:MAG TPA: hypothetical protein PK961_16040 [bacterium]|nr:hypothetical protein [bacterium]
MRWGEFFTEQSTVVAPTIPDNAAGDGDPNYCYDHTRPGGDIQKTFQTSTPARFRPPIFPL